MSKIDNDKSHQDEILENIKRLQSMESELYGELQSKTAANADVKEQEAIVDKINRLSQIRTSMFKDLTYIYGNVQSRLANKREDVVDKLTVAGIIEKELDNTKQNLNSLKSERNNKLRMVEINTYYEKQYNAHTEVMIIILQTFVPILGLAILRQKNIVPRYVLNTIIVLIAAIGTAILAMKIFDLSRRNNMDYDKYDWPSMTSNGTLKEYTAIPKPMGDDYTLPELGGCIGVNCCAEGTYYDTSINQCLVNSNSN